MFLGHSEPGSRRGCVVYFLNLNQNQLWLLITLLFTFHFLYLWLFLALSVEYIAIYMNVLYLQDMLNRGASN